MKDWKTTLVGLIVIAVGVVHLLAAKRADAAGLGMLTSGVGLILAKDGR